ncbi:MAG TPA: hypothetical protein VL362_00050 [Patescibacteria group bacterium]|jgi:cytoskeletal protein RodZ|nr:hypothetical protein [Patescibacteria group bacterium]
MNDTEQSDAHSVDSEPKREALSSRETEQPTKPLATPSTPPSAFSTTVKKSRKPLYIVLVLIGVVLVGALTYGLMSLFLPARSTADNANKPQSSAPAISPEKKAIDDATSIYTSAAKSEADTLSTDDSTTAADASNEAGTIGDTIDETTF